MVAMSVQNKPKQSLSQPSDLYKVSCIICRKGKHVTKTKAVFGWGGTMMQWLPWSPVSKAGSMNDLCEGLMKA